MPWTSSNRRTRLPPDWHARRARAYRAAGGRCQHHHPDTGDRCTWTGPLNGTRDHPGGHADHIDRTAGEDGPLQWLCPSHHNAKSSAEGNTAMQAIRAGAQHPRETHPATRRRAKPPAIH